MNVTTRMDNEIAYITITGDVDTNGAETLKTNLKKISGKKPRKVVMNLSSVRRVSSFGISNILEFHKRLARTNSILEIKGIHRNAYNIFTALNLNTLFPISLK